MVVIDVERTIAASPERVFSWLAEPSNLTAAPLVLRAAWAEDSVPPGVDAIREVIATGIWFREQITAYDPPRGYSYRIIKSFPAFGHEGGTMTLTAAGDGTHVKWVSSYSHPARGGGAPMNAVTSRLLPWNFHAILARCARELER